MSCTVAQVRIIRSRATASLVRFAFVEMTDAAAAATAVVALNGIRIHGRGLVVRLGSDHNAQDDENYARGSVFKGSFDNLEDTRRSAQQITRAEDRESFVVSLRDCMGRFSSGA